MENSSQINKVYCEAVDRTKCVNGIFLRVWHQTNEISKTDLMIRSAMYFLILFYLFLGVSIIADKFMGAIEMITSQERKFTMKDSNDVVYVKIWNETVSNLTLMALGSSAPEILLSIIETIGKNFEAGELGPGTIVGSAAFNLFVIIGICVMVVPKNETRKTKHISVFIVTTIWSLFAYIWLYLILAVISPGVVDLWEAVLTFIFFPLTVISAYIADTKIFFKQYLASKVLRPVLIQRDRNSSIRSEVNETIILKNSKDMDLKDNLSTGSHESYIITRTKLDYLEMVKEIRMQNKNMSVCDLEYMADIELLDRKPKSRAYYRMKAMRYVTGSPEPMRRARMRLMTNNEIEIGQVTLSNEQEIVFTPDHYIVYESEKKVVLIVKRFGSFTASTVIDVDYFTEDGTAKQGHDYVSTKGTITFECGENVKQIVVNIIDDEIYEEDEYFFVKLSEPRLKTNDDSLKERFSVKLGSLKSAVVMILDDDYGGTFHFETSKLTVAENIGNVEIKVKRSSGARGNVRIPFETLSDTAVKGIHYSINTNEITFKDNQTEEFINICIYDENEYEKSVTLSLELKNPIFESKTNEAMTGNYKLGEFKKLEIEITENSELKNIIDKLIKKGKIERTIYTSTWREQFNEAVNFEKDYETGKMPNCSQYILHYLSLFWKILFSLVPPPDIWNGWLCFIVSIVVIGILTAFIGDLASLFGCHIGLTDSVTAITFVALGTSLPDTFASKVAAINDKTADASIGNVIGSNAVNVFLGIGVAWSIATIYHAIQGTRLYVKSGSLGFSVTLFTILALVAICIMLLRRIKKIGGELGGPALFKYITGIFFLLMWIFYLIMSSLEIYCHIKGF